MTKKTTMTPNYIWSQWIFYRTYNIPTVLYIHSSSLWHLYGSTLMSGT